MLTWAGFAGCILLSYFFLMVWRVYAVVFFLVMSPLGPGPQVGHQLCCHCLISAPSPGWRRLLVWAHTLPTRGRVRLGNVSACGSCGNADKSCGLGDASRVPAWCDMQRPGLSSSYLSAARPKSRSGVAVALTITRIPPRMATNLKSITVWSCIFNSDIYWYLLIGFVLLYNNTAVVMLITPFRVTPSLMQLLNYVFHTKLFATAFN